MKSSVLAALGVVFIFALSAHTLENDAVSLDDSALNVPNKAAGAATAIPAAPKKATPAAPAKKAAAAAATPAAPKKASPTTEESLLGETAQAGWGRRRRRRYHRY